MSSRLTNWLDNNKHITHYNYSNFTNLQSIGKGSFGNVLYANCGDKVFALKSFSSDEITIRQIINELELHQNIGAHENIIQFMGITKIETDTFFQVNEYCLVLEYADGGTLNTYLKKNFNRLDWNDKLRLALELASAISFLHDNGIIHRDLHSKNILIHGKSIKVADFGLSKKLAEPSSTLKVLGVIPYMDPKSFMNENYKLNKKSDVYSVGVLLWQISSGREPFKDKSFNYDLRLAIAISDGKREKIIDGTPTDYRDLYTRCWKYDPDGRPEMHVVVSSLNSLIRKDDIYLLNGLADKFARFRRIIKLTV